MSEWKLKAACHNHPNPQWWFPTERGDHAIDAKAVCVTCPVRRECGEDAVNTDERFAVMGGYRCSDVKERTALRKWLGHDIVRTLTCIRCGVEFETTQRFKRCLECRGLVSIEPVREHIRALRAANVTNIEISGMAGVDEGTVSKLLNGHPQYEWLHCSREVADKILAIPIPGEAA